MVKVICKPWSKFTKYIKGIQEALERKSRTSS